MFYQHHLAFLLARVQGDAAHFGIWDGVEGGGFYLLRLAGFWCSARLSTSPLVSLHASSSAACPPLAAARGGG